MSINASCHGVVKIFRKLQECSNNAEDWTQDGFSKGSVNDYVMRTCDAILKHREQVIKWPSIEECRNISGRIRKAHGFVNCIGLIDGTLFPLAFAPMVNGEACKKVSNLSG